MSSDASLRDQALANGRFLYHSRVLNHQALDVIILTRQGTDRHDRVWYENEAVLLYYGRRGVVALAKSEARTRKYDALRSLRDKLLGEVMSRMGDLIRFSQHGNGFLRDRRADVNTAYLPPRRRR